MSDIYAMPVRFARRNDYTEWLLYERGQIQRPIALLRKGEMRRLVKAYAEVDPAGALAAVNEGSGREAQEAPEP